MNVANVGDVEAVLCRRGEPLLLTKKFVTTADRDECQRVCAADGIVTEVCRSNGSMYFMRGSMQYCETYESISSYVLIILSKI